MGPLPPLALCELGEWCALQVAGVFVYLKKPAMPYNDIVIFIETSLFTRLLPDYLTDDEYGSLQSYLMAKPDAGNLVRGSGGVRKVRWARSGRGKSSGVRVIYYWKQSQHEIWMLTLYNKSERSTIPGHSLKQIAEAVKHEKT